MNTTVNIPPRQRLSAERIRRRWSQLEIADQLGTTPGNVSRWERGITSPGPYFRSKLCELFGRSAQELGLTWDESDDSLNHNIHFVELRHRGTVASPDQDSSERPAEPGHESVLLNARSHNLPAQLTPLIGREQEVRAVCALLQQAEVHLVTLIGTGGVGKTRLGLQIATDLLDAFADGVYFVPLAPISDPDLVVPTIVQTLGLQETGDQSLLDLLIAYLRDKRMLLLLDNFEQVVMAAPQVVDLLTACLQLKVLVTSRVVLHVRAEYEFAVPALAVPDTKHLPDPETLSRYEAVALFIHRVQTIIPNFQVTHANASDVAKICAYLDGLPLAIELAAARMNLLSPQALLARMGQRLHMLTGGARDVPARQQTLRNTIEWSYHLLNAGEQRLFWRLSVFVGGCTLEAVEAVCAVLDTGPPAVSVMDGVASLIDKSLLPHPQQYGEDQRLMLLETIREYGLECLAASGEMEAMRWAHASYYLRLAEEAESELAGPQQVLWLERLEREQDNLHAAMRWLLEPEEGREGRQRQEMALRLGSALQHFWMIRGHLSEGQTFLERALAGSAGVAAPVRAKALKAAARHALSQGDYHRGEALCEESLALYGELGDPAGIALSLYLLGIVTWRKGDAVAARKLTEEALALYRKVDDNERIAYTLFQLAYLTGTQGDYARASVLLGESLALHRELGNKRGIAHSLSQLAQVLFAQGDHARLRSVIEESLMLAREVGFKEGLAGSLCLAGQLALSQGDVDTAHALAQESVLLYREMGHRQGMAQALSLLAKITLVRGDHAAARTLYEESLAFASEVDDKLNMVSYLEGLAGVVATQGEPVWAAQIWGAVQVQREALDVPISPVEHASYERAVATTRAQLGEKMFVTAWTQGRGMTPEQALAAQERTTLPEQCLLYRYPAPW